MALLDRIKERTGTELGDAELTAMIAAVESEITDRYGPHGETTIDLGDPSENLRWMRVLSMPRLIDISKPIVVVEIDPNNSGDPSHELTLASDDYRVLYGGRMLQRLTGGANSNPFWAPMVRVTFTPQGSEAARQEAIIKILQLDMSYRGLIKSERAGDYQWAGSVSSDSYLAEREKLLASIGSGRAFNLA